MGLIQGIYDRLNNPRHLLGIVAGIGHLLLYSLDLDTLAFDIQTEPPEQAHILVGYPNERETGDEVPAPIGVKQLIPGDDEKEDRHVMAETVFTREQIKKLTPHRAAITLTLPDTIIPRLSKDLFMGYGPGNRGYWDCEEKKSDDLPGKRHIQLSAAEGHIHTRGTFAT